jgi:hypothetical protein
MSSKLSALLLAGLLAGCGGGDPLEQDIAEYHARISPTLPQNLSMAKEFLDLTTQLKADKIGADEVAARWEQQIIPQADTLKDEVAAIQPDTAELQELHSQLVYSWTERAEAYHQMHEAFKSNNNDKFKKAIDRNLKAKLTEEQYFNQINVLILPYGVQLSPY